MAQLLSPVCTDSLKLQNPVQCFSSRSKWPILANNFNNLNWSSVGHSGKKRRLGRIKVAYQDSAASEEIADDYYGVLGLVIYNLFFNFHCLIAFLSNQLVLNKRKNILFV